MAKLAATRSTCYSRPVGAVIVRDRRVLTTGYNGAAPGTWHCTDKRQCYWRQPENQVPGIDPRELSRAIHAEMNAMAHAARKGIIIEGGTIYCTLSPCMNCFKVCQRGSKRSFRAHYDSTIRGGDGSCSISKCIRRSGGSPSLTISPHSLVTASVSSPELLEDARSLLMCWEKILFSKAAQVDC
jgi:dCMP deaminase